MGRHFSQKIAHSLVGLHLHGSLGPLEAAPETASRSVSHFCRADEHVQQTDRPRYSVYSNRPLSQPNAAMLPHDYSKIHVNVIHFSISELRRDWLTQSLYVTYGKLFVTTTWRQYIVIAAAVDKLSASSIGPMAFTTHQNTCVSLVELFLAHGAVLLSPKAHRGLNGNGSWIAVTLVRVHKDQWSTSAHKNNSIDTQYSWHSYTKVAASQKQPWCTNVVIIIIASCDAHMLRASYLRVVCLLADTGTPQQHQPVMWSPTHRVALSC